MNIRKRFFAFAASAILLVTVFSCSIGLDPAKSSGTTVSLQLASLVPPGGDRAVIQGTGYLYIQTGTTVADAKLYGPWEAGSGDKFSTDEIPPGHYDSFSIIYMDSPKLSEPLYLDIEHPTILSVFHARLSYEYLTLASCSFATLSGVAIRPNRENPVKATLIPATTIEVPLGFNYVPSEPGRTARAFFKINSPLRIYDGGVLDQLRIILYASGEPLRVSRLALYNVDGELLSVDNGVIDIAPSGFNTWIISCRSLRDSVCFLYIEYKGTISNSSSVNAEPYVPSSRPVWYVSNSGDSDGSDAAHPCTLDQAVACINNSTYSGMSSIILTEDINSNSNNITFQKDVRIRSLGTSPSKITYSGTDHTNSFFFIGDGMNPVSVSFTNCEITVAQPLTTYYCSRLVYVGQYGSLTLESGATLKNNQNNQPNGAGLYVSSNASAVMLPGSNIYNCQAANGGAVCVSGGAFKMDGGSILTCKAIDASDSHGGAVYVTNNGSFTMTDGIIGSPIVSETCSSTYHGGAIGVESGTFTFENGTIINCSASNGNGGAIWVSGSTATAVLKGGTITGCSAVYTTTGTGSGGGVYVGTSGTVNFLLNGSIAGVKMTGNTAQYGDLLYKDAVSTVQVMGTPAANGSDFSSKTGYPYSIDNIGWI